MKTAEEIHKIREIKAKEGEERLKAMKTKEEELKERARNEGKRFAEEVNLDTYVDSLIDSGRTTIDISSFAKGYPNYKEYSSINKIYELEALESGIIEGLTKRFIDNGFRFKRCTSYAGLIFELSL